MRVYFRFFWRWLSGLFPTCVFAVCYARHSSYSRGVLRDLIDMQVVHWQEFTRLCVLRHRAYHAHRRYLVRVAQFREQRENSSFKH